MNYSTRTKLNEKKQLAAHLSVYATAAGALVALAPDTNAQVEYSGEIDTLLFHYSDYFYIDLNNDGNDDVRFGGNFYSTITNWSFTTWWPYSYTSWGRGYRSAYISLNPSYQPSVLVTNSYSGYSSLAALPERYLVQNDVDTVYNKWVFNSYKYLGNSYFYRTFRSFSISVYVSSSSWYYTRSSSINTYPYANGNFINNGDKYIGIKLNTDTVSYFGWIRVNMDRTWDGSYLTVKDWALQSAAGRGLFTGADTIALGIIMDIDTSAKPLMAVTINFDEEILDTLQAGDLTISGGTLDSLVEVTPYREYIAYATKSNPEDLFVITIPASKITDLWGLENAEASVEYDEYVPPVIDGLQGINSLGYKLYPNPVSNMLSIDLPSEGKVTITDEAGRIMLVKDNVMNDRLDVSSFKSGMYLAKIQTKNGIAVQKIIKE